MQVELLTLDDLREQTIRLTKAGFVEQFPGAFLLPMGYLAVETIRSRHLATNALIQPARDATAAVSFGQRLRHDVPQTHPLAGCVFFLRPTGERTMVSVGRSTACDIAVPEASVSEQHCRIEVTSQGVLVLDMDSTNGTAVNLERLTPNVPRILADEDFLSIGRYSFQMITAQTLYSELRLLFTIDS